MPIVSRLLINLNNGCKHYEVLVKRQTNNDKKHDTSRNSASFLLSSTVAAQNQDGEPYGKVVGRGDHRDNKRSYVLHIIKTGQIVTGNSKHIAAMP